MPINRAPFNLLVDDDGTNTVGTVWGKQDIKDVILDPVDAFVSNGGTWSTYTPAWGGNDGVQPVLGNGTLSGRYVQIGKWIDVVMVLQAGSTTTFGTSTYWVFTLPFTPRVVASLTETHFRAGLLNGAGAGYPAATGYVSGGIVLLVTPAGALVNPTTPFTWNAGSIISIRGSYELP
jgi:hypothetical protein